MAHSYHHGREHSLGEQEDIYSTTSYFSSLFFSPLGQPAIKSRLPMVDILPLSVSLVCLIVAIMSVANDSLSWHLGQGNNQLIVLGLLLSIMNLCLASVAPNLFLRIEERFGESRLQNYEGILRNRPFGTRLDFSWRLVLGFMAALPIGLSVAYKTFTGGSTAMPIAATSYTGNTSYYGMFGPPGLQTLGASTGVTLFFNATLPFSVATSPLSTSDLFTSPNTEPPLPASAQPYGYNLLYLNNESTAVLDMPQPDYVSAVQSILGNGESWIMKASVLATVSTYNRSKEETPGAWNASFMNACTAAGASSGAYSYQAINTQGWCVQLVDHASPGPQNQQYIGLAPSNGLTMINWALANHAIGTNDYSYQCAQFSHYAQLYDINRQRCNGTWSITRSAIELQSGNCTGDILPPDQQLPITDNVYALWLGAFYVSSLAEFMGAFTTTRNQSSWRSSYYATATAAMLWSDITLYNGAANSVKPGFNPVWPRKNHPNLTYEEVGLVYPVNDNVVYLRPTIKKSPLLYAVLVVQPILILIACGSTFSYFRSSPIGKGFGLVSILAGVNRHSLDHLAGASLSGDLRENVKLIVLPHHNGRMGSVAYVVVPTSSKLRRNGKLVEKVVYH